MTDIFEKLNNVNVQLQGEKNDLIRCKSMIMSFIDKLYLYKQNQSSREYREFPTLKKSADSIADDRLLVYTEHLKPMRQDMLDRISDLNQLHINPWILDPFSIDSSSVDITIQEENIDIKSTTWVQQAALEMVVIIYGLTPDIIVKYPVTWQKVKLLLIAFPTSYLVERGFSKVNSLLTDKRNKLNVTTGGDLRLDLTKFKPDIEKF